MDATGISITLKKKRYFGVVPVVIETDGWLMMDITCLKMHIAIEGFHHFKVVNYVGIPMSWEQSADE